MINQVTYVCSVCREPTGNAFRFCSVNCAENFTQGLFATIDSLKLKVKELEIKVKE